MTKRRERVREAFDPEALSRICTMSEDEFSMYGTRVDLKPDKLRERFYYFKDNGSAILGVAHLDSVMEERRCDITETAAGPLVTSPSLDDRLGAYVILEMLPKLGITVDWLLTTGEEWGDSTAAEFESDKEYNWMIEFDRGGTDVVMYQYETPELVAMVKACSAVVGLGSYSDISMLDHMGVAGFNWGVGYRDYHGPRAHAWLEDTFRMVNRFTHFFERNADLPMPHDLDDGYFEDWEFCLCGRKLNEDDGYCPECDMDKIERYRMFDEWKRDMQDAG